MDSRGPESWYLGLPRFTRAYLTILLLVTVLSVLKVINPFLLSLDWTKVVKNLNLWRIFTNCLYVGPFSLRWVFFVVMFSQFSSYLEKNTVFTHSPGSYLYFIFLQMIFLSAVSSAFFWPNGYPYLADSLLFAIIYYWSKRDMWTVVSIYFFNVKGYQLPFALMFLHLVMGSSLWVDLMGIISGHLYYMLREVLPVKGYPNFLLKTPKFFDYVANSLDRLTLRYLPDAQTSPGSFQYRPRQTEHRSPGFIGRGVRLGGS